MQVTGTIVNIQPDGSYQSQNGLIYTHQMSIQSPQGLIIGQIGSKSEIYPINAGQEITVEMTNTQHGVRLKRIDPQYAGQSGSPSASTQSRQGGGKGGNDRNNSFALSYAKDLVVAGKIEFSQLFDIAGRMKTWLYGKPTQAVKSNEGFNNAINQAVREVRETLGDGYPDNNPDFGEPEPPATEADIPDGSDY